LHRNSRPLFISLLRNISDAATQVCRDCSAIMSSFESAMRPSVPTCPSRFSSHLIGEPSDTTQVRAQDTQVLLRAPRRSSLSLPSAAIRRFDHVRKLVATRTKCKIRFLHLRTSAYFVLYRTNLLEPKNLELPELMVISKYSLFGDSWTHSLIERVILSAGAIC
jgi:hypothetical protein